jgi:hypothetical protein
MRLEDGAVAVEVPVRGEQRSDLDILDAELLADADNVLKFVKGLLNEMLHPRDGGEEERAHGGNIACREGKSARRAQKQLAKLTGRIDERHLIAHRSSDTGQLHQLARGLEPRPLLATVLNEDLEGSRSTLGGYPFDEDVQDLAVVDDVHRLAERESSHDLIDDEDHLGFGGGSHCVRNDVEGSVEDGPRLLVEI